MVKLILGDTMKKMLFLTIIIVCFYLFLNDNEETLLVSSNSIDNSYQIYYLSFEKLNTNNFSKYINNDFKVLAIYPNINPIYSDKLDNSVKAYRFNNYSDENNLSTFTNLFLDKMIFLNEKEKYLINGIPIKIVKVYASTINVYKLLKKHPDVKYNYTLNGTYKKLD